RGGGRDPERRRRASRHAGLGAAAVGGVPAGGGVKPERFAPEQRPKPLHPRFAVITFATKTPRQPHSRVSPLSQDAAGASRAHSASFRGRATARALPASRNDESAECFS